MATSHDHLVERLRKAHRCQPEIRQIAEEMAGLALGHYDALSLFLLERGEDHALGIMLNAAAAPVDDASNIEDSIRITLAF